MTQEMLERAREEDWDAVAERERERRDDLRRCFTEATPAEHGELVAEALAALLHLNEELMALLAAARERVLEQGVTQVRTRTAIDRYRDVNGGR
jgi:transposase